MFYCVLSLFVFLLIFPILIPIEYGLALPTRRKNYNNDFLLNSDNKNVKDSDTDGGKNSENAWCDIDFLYELELEKNSLSNFFGNKVLSDATTGSFNFQSEISEYSCQLSRIVEKLMGQREGDIIVATGGGSATAGGGWVGRKNTWPSFLERYLNKLNDIVKDKKYKNNKVKFYNAAHGSTNSVYNALLQSSLYPSPTPSKRYLSSENYKNVPTIDMLLGEFRINDYQTSNIQTKYPEYLFEFWLRRALKINNVGNLSPIIGLVDVWDDRGGKSSVEDAWRNTSGKKFEASFPIGDILSVSLSRKFSSVVQLKYVFVRS